VNRLGLYLGLIGAACILLILRHDRANVFGIENDDFASLVWYGVLALVLGAAFLSNRARLGTNLRYLAIWLVAVLALVTIYVYRYELQDAAARVSGGLLPGSPVASRSADGRLQVTLIRSRDRHFRARGSVNGAAVAFLVDTGASDVVLSRRAAIAAGIDVDRLVDSAQVTTANGRTTAAPVTLDEIEIAGIKRQRVHALVARTGSLDGNLLGMSFLETLSAFEFRGDRLVLTD
jgi:aspartyl protease family protein